MEKEQQTIEAKKLLEKMSVEHAILFCEYLAEKLPNINNTPPIHRESEDKYSQFWRFGVVSVLKSIESTNDIDLRGKMALKTAYNGMYDHYVVQLDNRSIVQFHVPKNEHDFGDHVPAELLTKWIVR